MMQQPVGPHAGRPGSRLDELLRTGPFADALRAAIRESKLSQDRIVDRLRRRGVPISPATLSLWQSGRHQPERPTSLAALSALETVLGVGSGALSCLLEPPRPRGRRSRPVEMPAIDALVPHPDAIQRTLERVDNHWSGSITRVSHHDRVEVGAHGGELGTRTREVLRATEDGPDRCVYFHTTDQRGGPPPEIRPVRGCRLGAAHAEPSAGLSTVELLFPHALSKGEAVLLEYCIVHREPYPSDGFYVRGFRRAVREYVLEIQFTPPALPVRCVHFWSSGANADPVDNERLLTLDEDHRALLVLADVGPGRHGIRWQFD